MLLSGFVRMQFCSAQFCSTLGLQSLRRVQEGWFRREREQVSISIQLLELNEELEDIQDLHQRVSVELGLEQSVVDLKEQFLSRIQLSKTAKVYGLDRTEYADCTTIEQLIEEPFYLKVDSDKVYHIQQEVASKVDEYSYLKEYFNKMEVPLLERKIMVQYLIRLDSLMEMNVGNRMFVNDGKGSVVEKSQLSRALLDAFIDQRNTQSDHEQEMYQGFFQLKQRYAQLKQIRNQIMEQARKVTKLQMGGGLVVLFGHFTFMAAGIYVYYDWNVMEPIGYFLNTGGMIYLSYQYFKLNNEWTPNKFSNYLINKNFIRLCNRNKHDPTELTTVEQQLQLIRNRIKTNIVTNL